MGRLGPGVGVGSEGLGSELGSEGFKSGGWGRKDQRGKGG